MAVARKKPVRRATKPSPVTGTATVGAAVPVVATPQLPPVVEVERMPAVVLRAVDESTRRIERLSAALSSEAASLEQALERIFSSIRRDFHGRAVAVARDAERLAAQGRLASPARAKRIATSMEKLARALQQARLAEAPDGIAALARAERRLAKAERRLAAALRGS